MDFRGHTGTFILKKIKNIFPQEFLNAKFFNLQASDLSTLIK